MERGEEETRSELGVGEAKTKQLGIGVVESRKTILGRRGTGTALGFGREVGGGGAAEDGTRAISAGAVGVDVGVDAIEDEGWEAEEGAKEGDGGGGDGEEE